MPTARKQSIVADLIVGLFLLVLLPYAAGFLYAVIMMPAYSFVCHGKSDRADILHDVIQPVDIADYRYFLMGRGCHLPRPVSQSSLPLCAGDDLQCRANSILSQSLGGITESPGGTTRFFGDDIVSALLGYVAGAYATAANTGAMLAISLRNTNTIFQTIVALFFLFVIGIFGTLAAYTGKKIGDKIFAARDGRSTETAGKT